MEICSIAGCYRSNKAEFMQKTVSSTQQLLARTDHVMVRYL